MLLKNFEISEFTRETCDSIKVIVQCAMQNRSFSFSFVDYLQMITQLSKVLSYSWKIVVEHLDFVCVIDDICVSFVGISYSNNIF